MKFFPQLSSGAIAQLPFRRTHNRRFITNLLESGEQLALADPSAATIQWNLQYVDLSDTEAQSLNDLFTACAGRYASFLFIDPLANLLGWSEDLSRPDWQSGQLTTALGLNDPFGTQRASLIANGSAGVQQLAQTLSIPGDYVACFGVWLRSDAPAPVTLQRDGTQNTFHVTSQWRRYSVSAAGTPGTAQSAFSIALTSGQTVEAWGFQVEAQPYPSTYRPSQNALGVYAETYFAEDRLTITNTAPGLSSVTLDLISRA
jgi:hypothetical protein